MRFDDSLPEFARVLQAYGVDPSANDIRMVRDATGRLYLVSKNPPAEGFVGKLREKLGPYAAPAALVTGPLADRLLGDAAARVIDVKVDGVLVRVHMIDRRVVGADWLREPEPVAKPPRLVFGSLKGGVGRSTALAVLAADLANHGFRVLAVDLDVEAPGIGFMLLPAGHEDDQRSDRRPKYGAVDFLVENGLGGIDNLDLVDFVGISHLANGLLHVVPAVGRTTDDHPENMIAKLSRALIEDVTDTGTRLSVAEQVKDMIDRLAAREPYDVVLIDARAGMAEISASALFSTGASQVLLFATEQEQTFRGYRYILSHLVSTWGVEGPDDWRSRLTFVQARAPASRVKREAFRERLHELCAEQLYDEDDPDLPTLFNFGPNETGPGIPHDATYVAYHPDYDAFDPLRESTQLDEDVYRGPFGDFLARAWQLLGRERPRK